MQYYESIALEISRNRISFTRLDHALLKSYQVGL